MPAEMFVLFVLLIVLVGALPRWPYSQTWGYVPSGVVLVIGALMVVWLMANQRGTGNLGQDAPNAAQDIGQDVKQGLRNVAEKTRQAADDLSNR